MPLTMIEAVRLRRQVPDSNAGTCPGFRELDIIVAVSGPADLSCTWWSYMRYPKASYIFIAVLVLTILFFASSMSAATYRVLHTFGNAPDGAGLYGRLAIDANGNLYGATSGGGAYSEGTVFELSPVGGGKWNETIIHSFCADYPQCSDGALPMSGLSLDAAGNLYGPTRQEVFKLVPGPDSWNLSLIHNEGSNADLTIDGAGNLYGEIGLGNCNGGEIMKLKPPPDSGYWISKDLYDFCLHNNQWSKGIGPNHGLTWDAAGNLYGVTDAGGKANFGVVFQLERTPSGWKQHVLHSFGGAPDGEFVQGGVVLDSAGRVYGSTEHGGTGCGGGQGCGTLYQLSKQPDGHWKEKILYDFPNTKNGATPVGTLAIDAAGSLYGVGGGGGGPCGGGGCGVVFKLLHNPDDSFTYQVLHRFQGTDGLAPVAGVILDAKGNIYGTTSTGGKGGYGVVFKITQ